MESIFWMAMLTNAAALGIAAAVFIPLSRAVVRRMGAPRADADRVRALESELEATQARLGQAEERLQFVERLLEAGPEPAALTRRSPPAADPQQRE